MGRHMAARRPGADTEAIYRRLSGDGVACSSQGAFSRQTQKSFRGWMVTKGAEASGSNRESSIRALCWLNQYPQVKQPAFKPIGVHEVARNEYICQRSVSKLTRYGSLHPVKWDGSRTGPHLHRNGKRHLKPLTGGLKGASSTHNDIDEHIPQQKQDLTPRRASLSTGGTTAAESGRQTPDNPPRVLGARSASPAFTPMQEPYLSLETQKAHGAGFPANTVESPTA